MITIIIDYYCSNIDNRKHIIINIELITFLNMQSILRAIGY